MTNLHRLPKFIPEELMLHDGASGRVKITTVDLPKVDGSKTTAVPRANDNGKKISPNSPGRPNGKDAYFLSQLLSVYGNNSFKRLNLDAGRLNDLIDLELVIPLANMTPRKDPSAEFSIDLDSVMAFFGSVSIEQLRS